ncbi:cupin domain-containing protein [Metabacillus iocasae]|uniref:Oxalate decarboxylase/phosphoglucose isomerase-like protein (Cupin superfamily) n=1 Tax=Priestia iocasae TaxID=2291674 RepID=A0ABS2QY50_9BACI|nr:cupin domain-containing protein [Metabacillus iocasae]MBM7704360.1 oxalate decarboxylase/phosphoglucose isomerase-like protein (cupin superfamily) [Metabacillus iocasae]
MRTTGFVTDNKNLKKTSGTPNLFFDSKKSVDFEKNADNVIYKVTSTQLPAMIGGAFADVYLTKGNIREPHWHPNAWELDVVVSGKAQISIIDPDTNKLHNYTANPGQVVFIPMGWWHWITPLSEKLHLHLFFNNDQFETALGSTTLRLTPPEVYELSYGINAKKMADTLSPIKGPVEIGPPLPEQRNESNCTEPSVRNEEISIRVNGKDPLFNRQ